MSSPCAITHAKASCAGVHFFFTSDFACMLDEIEIALNIFALKSRGLPPVIVLRQMVESFFIAAKLPPIFALSSRARVLP